MKISTYAAGVRRVPPFISRIRISPPLCATKLQQNPGKLDLSKLDKSLSLTVAAQLRFVCAISPPPCVS